MTRLYYVLVLTTVLLLHVGVRVWDESDAASLISFSRLLRRRRHRPRRGH